jgi:hypothetical protein
MLPRVTRASFGPFAAGVLLAAAACGSSGDTPPMCMGTTTTLTVTVVNDACEPVDVCNATVTATGPSKPTFTASGGQGSCDYTANVTAGSYVVTATAPNLQGTSNIVIQTGCSTFTTIDLSPTN